MYELAARETIMLYTLGGSGLALAAGMFLLGAARMLALWITGASYATGCLLLGCSVGLVAVRLVFPELRAVAATAVLVLTLS